MIPKIDCDDLGKKWVQEFYPMDDGMMVECRAIITIGTFDIMGRHGENKTIYGKDLVASTVFWMEYGHLPRIGSHYVCPQLEDYPCGLDTIVKDIILHYEDSVFKYVELRLLRRSLGDEKYILARDKRI